jgi:cytochrome c oxidase assembly factor CtaG
VTPILAHIGGGTFAPLQILPAFLAAVLYAMRVRTLAGTPRAVPGWRQACFLTGVGLILLVLVSPVSHISEELFLAHMTEHLLLGDFGTLLIVLGLTGPLLAPVLRLPGMGWVRVVGHPLVALPLWALDLYLWHVPAIHTAALEHSSMHALQHACFIFFGINMWMPLFGPLPKPAWFTNAWQLAYIIGVRLAGAILGNVLVWSDTAFYHYYAKGEAYWHISPMADQQVAGGIMMIEGSLLTISLFAWLFLKTARQGEERQELLDLARARGVELTDRRAARAVAAGRGAELRRRIETAPEGGAVEDVPEAAAEAQVAPAG